MLTNQDAYQRWVRTTHAMSTYVNTTLNWVDMSSEKPEEIKHRETMRTEVLKSEKAIKDAQEAVESYLNPFII